MSVLLAAGGEVHALGGSPWLMGIVNATPDSFSDAGLHPTLESRVALAAQLVAQGAQVIDIGGESGTTNRPPVDASEEIERVVGLIERVAATAEAIVSVDTYKPQVAAAAIAAGAAIVNDVSGLRDPGLADVCAQTGAALVVMHTRAAPKQRMQDPNAYPDVLDDVMRFLTERLELARSRGVADEQLIVDPVPTSPRRPPRPSISCAGRRGCTSSAGRSCSRSRARTSWARSPGGRRVSAGREPSPRWRTASTFARISSGCMRWRRRRTSSPCCGLCAGVIRCRRRSR